jgi:uncharacterized protein (TIGR04255 family)
MARQYRRPPIVEASMDARFEPGGKWDLSTLGEFQKSFSEVYTDIPRQLANRTIEVTSGERSDASLSVKFTPERAITEFASEGRQHLIRVSPNSLSVHTMAPYGGWEDFSARIANALKVYAEVAKPSSLLRMGIRYINKVDLGASPVDLSDYFNIPVATAESLGFLLGSFFVRTEATRDDGVRLIQTFASTPAETAVVLLDIDVIRSDMESSATFSEPLMAEISELREMEREVFEASITDKLRGTFGGYQER